MDRRLIVQQLDRVEVGQWSTHNRVDWLTKIAAIPAYNRVLGSGWGCALARCCPDGKPCWAGTTASDRPGRAPTMDPQEVDGSIFWPWIGERYEEGGVCLVGITPNMDDDASWSIALEYDIAWHVSRDLRCGLTRSFGGSRFHYRVAATAAAVLSALARTSITASPDPRLLPGAIERIARLQAIKCTPRSARGAPRAAMWKRCPSRYLTDELRVLKPGVVVSLGAEPRKALARIGDIDLWIDDRPLRRGTIDIDGHVAHFVGIAHPAARPPTTWEVSQARLVRNLARSPFE